MFDRLEMYIRERISFYEESWNTALGLGWPTEYYVNIRHMYLKALLDHQLRRFNRD